MINLLFGWTGWTCLPLATQPYHKRVRIARILSGEKQCDFSTNALTRRSSFSPLMAVDAGSFPACFTGLSQRVRRLNYVRNITFIHLGSSEGTSDRISDISGLSDVRYFWGCRHGLLLPLLSLRQACHITCHAYKLIFHIITGNIAWFIDLLDQ